MTAELIETDSPKRDQGCLTPTVAVDRVADLVAGVAGALTVAGMIATPLLPPRSPARTVLSSVVVGGLFVTTTANAVRRWGLGRAGGAVAATVAATGLVERIGTKTGVPFGTYAYSARLQPQVAHVPVIVPLAWFAMGLPSREAAHAALGTRSTPATRVALGSVAMTAWDLFLDPQMVGEGYWAWAKRGIYRGIPLSNYLGWFLTGLGIMAALEGILPPGRANSTNGVETRLVGEYGYMSVMQSLGFARFFRDPVVALVGGAAMLPIAGTACVNLIRGGR